MLDAWTFGGVAFLWELLVMETSVEGENKPWYLFFPDGVRSVPYIQ